MQQAQTLPRLPLCDHERDLRLVVNAEAVAAPGVPAAGRHIGTPMARRRERLADQVDYVTLDLASSLNCSHFALWSAWCSAIRAM